MNKGDIITFDAKKNFTFVKTLGAGGTGDTHLFKDETTGMLFAIKKYSPKDERFLHEYYERFVEEIKILLNITHPNVVRVYTYYLYPKYTTGYLQMEYVDGISIDQYTPMPWNKSWEEVFIDCVNAFEYLEKHHILHRDIRPANIMIDDNNHVKIIDFGFGKQLNENNYNDNSILLNWPATEMPDEIHRNHYDEQTEIFFLGTLFRHLTNKDNISFRYNHIVEKMIKLDPAQRYDSFSTIVADISLGVLGGADFSEGQKKCYRLFADELSSHINYFSQRFAPIEDYTIIVSKIAGLIQYSILEEYIQDNRKLIDCFVEGGYSYNSRKNIPVQVVVDFYKMINELDLIKRKVLFDNLFVRLSSITIQSEFEDLPFS